jgi:hypothetical protein
MNLKEQIQYGKTVKVTNGKEVIEAHVVRINMTCFSLQKGNLSLTFSFTGRLDKKSVEHSGNWAIVKEDSNNDLFERLAKATKPEEVNIKPSQAFGEHKVWNEDNTDYHWLIVDKKGRGMILQRGEQYLEFKIAQQGNN